jgi:hypothetical protein
MSLTVKKKPVKIQRGGVISFVYESNLIFSYPFRTLISFLPLSRTSFFLHHFRILSNSSLSPVGLLISSLFHMSIS